MKSIHAIENKFKSGNLIPCEFARVYLAEWQAIVAEVAELTTERDGLREKIARIYRASNGSAAAMVQK